MTAAGDEHERTMAFCEVALGQIKALQQPAQPRNYEMWYHYATGYNPSLNKTINDLLARKGTLTPGDVDEIYEAFLSSARLGDRVDSMSGKVVGEIEQVMAMIDTAMGTASSYTESLADATNKLGAAKDSNGLRTIIESLVQSTKEIERSNHALEMRLKASKQEINELQENLEAVRHESLTDPLTSLANRKYFDQSLTKHLSEAASNSDALSLLMIDIDRFKSFNDTFGHLTGDQVLRLVAQCVKQNVKGQDIAARYGGEEFGVVLPHTALRQGLTVGDHIRRAVMSKDLVKRSTGESLGRVTISVGIATYHKGDTAQTLIERADSCLYAAKRTGRNRVICEADPEVAPGAEIQVA